MAVSPPNPHLLLLYIYLLLLLTPTTTASPDSSSALLKFKSSIKLRPPPNDAFSTWLESKPPCSGDLSNWAHVRCSQGSVQSIKLDNLALAGDIDLDSLARLPSLRTLSLIQNSFQGPLPSINNLSSLKSVFLSDNKFSGEIPDDAFKGMQSLKKLHLARNGFTGKIPTSLVHLPKLLELRLEGNKFSGKIPDFQQKQLLQLLDVSGNDLEGPIPVSLAKMNSSFFSGNKGLCGAPLPECSLAAATSSTTATTEKKSSGSSIGIVIGAVVGAIILLAAAIGLVLCLRKRNYSSLRGFEANPTPSNLRRKASFKEEDTTSRRGSPAHSSGGRRAEAMKLSFLREETHKFELQDLLKASAEILGSGCFGSSYKTALTTGAVMVVKRFRQMNNLDKDEFQEHMRRLGRLNHPNLLPLVAYYYRKEEKLLVTQFVPKGSLAVHLHSKVHPVLDWASRLKIIKGVTSGLVYLYNELPSLIAPHGHLKSSNVLLNDHSNHPLITDYGLIPLINQESAQQLMVAYKSPEYLQSTRVTRKTDVWNLGVLILEILTGKFPANFLRKAGQAADQDQDLADWVSSVGPTPEVLDKEMKAASNCENEMVKMLKIGLACCEADLEKRLDLKEVAEKIEEVREKDGDDSGFFSSRPSDAAQSVGEGSGTN